jgi:hypothetical protein
MSALTKVCEDILEVLDKHLIQVSPRSSTKLLLTSSILFQDVRLH